MTRIQSVLTRPALRTPVQGARRKTEPFARLVLAAAALACPACVSHASPPADYNIVWEKPSESARDSMPLGGGNLQCNVWVEKNDLMLLMGSTDAFCNGRGRLAKLGLVRLSLNPNPFPEGFRQVLLLAESVVDIRGGKPGAPGETSLRLWVDAFRPVIHVSMDSTTARDVRVVYESGILSKRCAESGLVFHYRHGEAVNRLEHWELPDGRTGKWIMCRPNRADHGAASDGETFVNVTSDQGGMALRQPFATQKGQNYTVTFDAARRPGHTTGALTVAAAGCAFTVEPENLQDTAYTRKSFRFAATEDATELLVSLSGAPQGSMGYYLDNLSVKDARGMEVLRNGSFEEHTLLHPSPWPGVFECSSGSGGDPVRESIIRQYDIMPLRDKVPDPLRNLTFGGIITSPQLRHDRGALATPRPVKHMEMRIAIRIEQDDTQAEWERSVRELACETEATALSDFARTREWWRGFWDRSWIVINPGAAGDERGQADAWTVGRNYQLARYMLACNRTGRLPTQFNAGIFAFGDGERYWEFCQFMAQNQRLVYWPLLKTGDFDVMLPGLDFYRDLSPLRYALAEYFWGIRGAIYPEGLSVYGLNSLGVYDKSGGNARGHTKLPHLTYHYTSSLDFAYMMLEYGRYSGQSLRAYVPVIRGCVEFYDNYYQKLNKQRTGRGLDKRGNLVIYPSNAVELYDGCRNNTDALAGLHAITKQVTELPQHDLSKQDRAYFEAVRKRLSPLATTTAAGKEILAVAESWEGARDPRNAEFPQMYAVFPFHRYGVSLPDLSLARDTWRHGAKNEKMQKDYFCWYQSAIFCARLGLVDEAKSYTLKKLLHPHYPGCVPERAQRFPAFWETIGQGFDIAPDIDHAGCAMIGLQEMLLQTPGRKIVIAPAWPQEWDCDFKLHAPYSTVVAGRIENGKLIRLTVTPTSRRKDVVVDSR